MTFFVAVARLDIHNRGKTSAIFRTETSGVDVGIEDDIGLENRIKTYGMKRIIYYHAVQQTQVLYHAAAANIELSALVACGVDAGQHLHVLSQIALSANRGHLLYLCGTNLLHTHLRALAPLCLS